MPGTKRSAVSRRPSGYIVVSESFLKFICLGIAWAYYVNPAVIVLWIIFTDHFHCMSHWTVCWCQILDKLWTIDFYISYKDMVVRLRSQDCFFDMLYIAFGCKFGSKVYVKNSFDTNAFQPAVKFQFFSLKGYYDCRCNYGYHRCSLYVFKELM